MNTASYKFHLITKHDGKQFGSEINEYEYAVLYKSNSGKIYRSYDNWTEYRKTAKEAKLGIVYRMEALGIITPLMNDVIPMDELTPYFIELDTDDYEAYNVN
jgi:tRNA A-37 threonylcarbamoyl transferase component Bud32